MPPLVYIAVKILFQSKRFENCLTFELAKYNLIIFWLYNTIVFGKLRNVNIIFLSAFPMEDAFIRQALAIGEDKI